MGIITTTDELEQYIESNAGVDFNTLKPSLKTAEKRFLLPALGRAQYDALIAAYEDAGNDFEDIEDAALKKLAIAAQEAISNLGMMIALDRLSVTISESGIRRNETGDSKSAFQYQEINLKESYAGTGFDALEHMLSMMEADTDNYALWRSSEAFTEQTRFLISSATMFSRFYMLYRSRISYMAIRSIMHQVENFALKKVTGTGLLNAIRTGIRNNNLDEKYQALMDEYIGYAIALLTISKALVYRLVDISDKGVTVQYTAPDNHRPSEEPALTERVKLMVNELERDGNQYLTELAQVLAANPDDYPDYEAPAPAQAYITVNNNAGNSFYGLP